jgi:ABC-2 type transporter
MQVWAGCGLAQQTDALIDEHSQIAPGSTPLAFATAYAQPMGGQIKLLLKRAFTQYWRTPQYNMLRFIITLVMGLLFGTLFWARGNKRYVR